MATVVDRPTSSPRRRSRQSFETWQWFFMRISGLVLVVLALGHFALTHIVNDVVDTDAEFVAERWSNPLWRTYDWALLTLALFHGLNGLRVIIDDYVRSPGKRAAVKSVIYVVSGTLFVYGTLTIIVF
jgi:succinate dehydrogenase / fumarate reductase membrane anchor subunit